jgi:CBS domain-containing protein
MFAIYDVQGRRFRSTLEHLQKVRATQASKRASLRSDGGEQTPQNLAEQTGDRTADHHPVSYDARQAYLDTLHIKEREAVVHAYQLMSHPVVTVPLELDIAVARRHFREQPYYQLPVLDRQQRIAGILSERDLLRFLVTDGEQISYVPGKTVADAMAAEVITADPVTDVRRIAQVMLSYHLSAIPVVDEQDALIGLVSRSDILRAVTSDPPLSLWT